LDRRLDGLQNRSRHGGEEKNSQENKVLRRIFRNKEEEVTGSWTKFLNVEELHNLYSFRPVLG
jgi:hypothetical protein